MKVGTDGLLLATSTPLAEGKLSILDIGCGTGLISLVIAQRSPEAVITAVEIDQAAANEATFNFKSSPFSNRLSVFNNRFCEFTSTATETFDQIICNPPFFEDSQAFGSRKKARDSTMLPADELVEGVSKLLDPEGQFSTIIPFQNEESILEISAKKGLYPKRLLRIRGRRESKIIRSIIHFRKHQTETSVDELYIEVDQRHEYSTQYINLTKDFLTIFD